ncbi:MAG: papain-like cysteine peptidase [Parachlamydia sp.]|jgi:hypothetical protein|nr:papain-like cysteine peptidase [Parachlamydia sp.]
MANKRKYILLIIFFFAITGKGLANDDLMYDEAVSLGCLCQVAQQLNLNGIRHQSYPFDWIVTHAEGPTRFIANQGAGFLDLDQITLGEKWANTNFIIAYDHLYNFILLHNFNIPFHASYVPIKDQFDKRIRRFFQLLQSDKKILFVRLVITQEEAELLDHVLQTCYPTLIPFPEIKIINLTCDHLHL